MFSVNITFQKRPAGLTDFPCLSLGFFDIQKKAVLVSAIAIEQMRKRSVLAVSRLPAPKGKQVSFMRESV